MTPTSRTHLMNFPDIHNPALSRVEQGINFCSCFPTPMAQKSTAMIHSSFGAMQLFAGAYFCSKGSAGVSKIQASRVVHLQKTVSDEDQARYNEYKSMVASGSGHFIDGVENTVRGSIGWALGKYGLNAMQHFPGRTKMIPGAIGGAVLFAVNLYFPAVPFGQIIRS